MPATAKRIALGGMAGGAPPSFLINNPSKWIRDKFAYECVYLCVPA